MKLASSTHLLASLPSTLAENFATFLNPKAQSATRPNDCNKTHNTCMRKRLQTSDRKFEQIIQWHMGRTQADRGLEILTCGGWGRIAQQIFAHILSPSIFSPTKLAPAWYL